MEKKRLDAVEKKSKKAPFGEKNPASAIFAASHSENKAPSVLFTVSFG